MHAGGESCMCKYIKVYAVYYDSLTVAPNASCALALLSMLQLLLTPPPPPRSLWTPPPLHLAPTLTGNQSHLTHLFTDLEDVEFVVRQVCCVQVLLGHLGLTGCQIKVFLCAGLSAL